MIYTAVDAFGEPVCRISCADESAAALNTPAGCTLVRGEPPSMDCWRQGDQWVEKPLRPSPSHSWDAPSHAWVDRRTAADARAQALARLKVARDAHLRGGFVWDGSEFDSDQTAQTRMLGAYLEAQSQAFATIAWRLADNSWRVLTADELCAAYSALQAHVRHCLSTFCGLEAAVLSAATVADADAINWPSLED